MLGLGIRITVSSHLLLSPTPESLTPVCDKSTSGWMADGLKPVSGQKKTQFCSWSATLIDVLDTLWIMGLHEEFDQAVNASLTIDFKHNVNRCQVNLFESTIRYLGGLLAAYDLSQEAKLLPKLVEVGDMLYSAFNTSNGMPCSFCHLASRTELEEFAPSPGVSMADIGSLYLEFGRL
jgi:mannosyl-oligosaccharide alpha-1,2-mannosidase